MKIITDTSTLLSPAEGTALGITVVPVSVTVKDRTYKDFEEIGSEEFLRFIQMGETPTSSQPSIGDMLDVLEEIDDSEDALFLTVGDGLSGTYQTALAARNCLESKEHIHIINSKTLAGPLRYMAMKAADMKHKGYPLEEIRSAMDQCIASSISFIIPEDFSFLKRSGRLSPAAARLCSSLHLLPVLTQTKDKTRITPVTIKRSWKTATDTVISQLRAAGVDSRYLISICHAGAESRANEISMQIKAALPHTDIEILMLSPALITHAGPGSIAIQAVLK